MDANLRNLKDFLTLYNKITEICFSRCVENLFERNLAPDENKCVDNCVLKFAAFNRNMMNVYVEVQTQINERRVKELEENQQLQQQLQQQQQQQQQQIPKSTVPEKSTTTVPQGGSQNAYA